MWTIGQSLSTELISLGVRIRDEAISLAELVESASLAREKTPGKEKAVPRSEIEGLRAIYRKVNVLFGFLHMSCQEVTKRAGEFQNSLQGPVHVLEEPDRSDDEWDEVHGKYLQLMQDYIGSFAEVHHRHKIMMSFYKKELEPRREALLRRSGIEPESPRF